MFASVAVRRSVIVVGVLDGMKAFPLERDGFCATVLETVGALVIVLDRQGHIIGFNRASELLSGYSFDEVRGKRIFESLLAPEHVDDVRRAFAYLRPDSFPQNTEYDWMTRTGERRHIIWNNAAILGDNGTADFIVGTGIDVTEKRNVERRIERAKREWETTFDAVPDLIAIVDTEKRIVRVNTALAARLGHRPGELVGKRCCETLHGVACPPDWCLHKRLQTNGNSHVSRELRLGGDFQITVTPLYEPCGTLWGSVHVFRDLAPLMQADAARRREELARLDRLQMPGLVSAALAHELNQPLAGILCNAEAGLRMLEKAEDAGDVEIGAVFSDVVADVKRAGQVIEGMRALLEGRTPPAELLDPTSVLEEAERLLKGDAEQRGIALCVTAEAYLPPVLVGRTPLLQVLLNLMLNAFDAVDRLPEDRRVVQITAISKEAHVEIAVSDHGPGVPAELSEAVFDLLHTSKAHGVGMGLAISRSLVEAYRGKLAVANAADGGAVFTAKLPVAEQMPLSRGPGVVRRMQDVT